MKMQVHLVPLHLGCFPFCHFNSLRIPIRLRSGTPRRWRGAQCAIHNSLCLAQTMCSLSTAPYTVLLKHLLLSVYLFHFDSDLSYLGRPLCLDPRLWQSVAKGRGKDVIHPFGKDKLHLIADLIWDIV